MKRTHISLEQIAAIGNLHTATYKAAKGKRNRSVVLQFLDRLDENLNQLAEDILTGRMPYGCFRTFSINDPKPRLIRAACFEDRVFHHALMNHAGPILEKAMFGNSFACRPDKGIHRAVQLVQQSLQRFSYFVKIDISAYFPAINHRTLLRLLTGRFKGSAINAQFERILASHHDARGYGLPIGSLTSQYFANYYLDGFDRWLSGHQQVRANLRYMDDVIWWVDSRSQAVEMLEEAKFWLRQERELTVKQNVEIQNSVSGVSYCGFRVTKGALRLSRRRKRRYQQRRDYWERLYHRGEITVLQLQNAYAAVEAITAGTDSQGFRRENLRRYPALDI